MVRPAALYNKARFSRDFASLGRVVAALCGNSRISREDLTDAELSALEELENENEEMDKNAERERKRKAEYREARARQAGEMSQGQSARAECPAENPPERNVPGTNRSSSTTVQPTNRTTNQPTVQPTNCTNRSVTVIVPLPPPAETTDERNGTENGNGNGTVSCEMMAGGVAEAKRLGRRFAAAARADQGAFFDAEFDAITVLAAVTGDYGSLKRWRQLATAKGDGAVREEAFRFWREVSAGEDVKNRGAALNKRLAALPDETAPDARERPSTPSARSGQGKTTPPEARTRQRGEEEAV